MSEPISVTFDTSFLPDLEILEDDIQLYPPSPTEGEELSISVLVRNKSLVDANDVTVRVLLWDSMGNIELLASENIPHIGSNSEELIPISLDTTGKQGWNTIFAYIDPYDEIFESDEENNEASREFRVVVEEGVSPASTTFPT